MDLDSIVPWGRSFDEYLRMFSLTDAELGMRIVGCADGPASFNAEATRYGARVISCDPIYGCSAGRIRERISATYSEILEKTRRSADVFVWDSIRSIEELGERRMAAMTRFLDDYEGGRSAGRYIQAELPTLPFGDKSFDLALCSHFLFLYTTHLGAEFHRLSIREMCRVATEARIFPLLTLAGERSAYVDLTRDEISRLGYDVSIERVPYEFQKGGNEMMRIRRVGSGISSPTERS